MRNPIWYPDRIDVEYQDPVQEKWKPNLRINGWRDWAFLIFIVVVMFYGS